MSRSSSKSLHNTSSRFFRCQLLIPGGSLHTTWGPGSDSQASLQSDILVRVAQNRYTSHWNSRLNRLRMDPN